MTKYARRFSFATRLRGINIDVEYGVSAMHGFVELTEVNYEEFPVTEIIHPDDLADLEMECEVDYRDHHLAFAQALSKEMEG